MPSKKIKFKYSKRILALINWIKTNSLVIDVGTDHAFLPIALIDQGITEQIIAIDNNQEPFKKATANIEKAGYTELISLILNDGLKDIIFNGNEIIVIAGMGGILISNILKEAKNRLQINQKLILQPNWTWFELRKWLAENGFEIEEEQIVFENNKYYSQLLVNYSGVPYQITDTEAFCGLNIKINSDSDLDQKIYKAYLSRLRRLALLKGRGNSKYHSIIRNIDQGVSNAKTQGYFFLSKSDRPLRGR